MPAIGIFAASQAAARQPGGLLLTFVVPAVGGCNLRCAVCFIAQRRETENAALQPHEYAQFIRETAASHKLHALAIQGYEPLLPTSVPYTQAILTTGRLLGLPTAIVTNGTHLERATDWLCALAPKQIVVSLDAASPEVHDRLRGIRGSWGNSVAGIRHALRKLAPQTNLDVASILTPSGSGRLMGMPRLLRDLGVLHWIISPLLMVRRDDPGGIRGTSETLYRNIASLQDASDAAGVLLTVDDELDCLRHTQAVAKIPELGRFDVHRLPSGLHLIRLSPDGACSVNREILQQVGVSTARWRPAELHAGDFLTKLVASVEKRKTLVH